MPDLRWDIVLDLAQPQHATNFCNSLKIGNANQPREARGYCEPANVGASRRIP